MTRQRSLAASLLATLALLAGCATAPGVAPPPKEDPWEGFNRKVYSFNETVDEAVLKPVATAYRDVVPQLVRTGVSNVLGNLSDIWSAANHLLQGKVHHGLDMGMRVLTNTVFGLGGVLDPATEMGLVRRPEDFGQTMGRWGVGPGPYLVLPFLGPSTLRDTGGLLLDRQAWPSAYARTDAAGYGVTTLEIINLRANLLGATQFLDAAALDKYSFLRQVYLARRQDAVYDGAPPLENFDDGDEPAKAPAAAPSTAKPAAPK
jgi:phospholipid-binding lipoprotein MlaA